MKRGYFILALSLFLTSSYAKAETGGFNTHGGFGAGFELGQPIGVSGKLWLSSLSAVDAGIGYHYNHNMDLHSDFLIHSYALGDLGGHPLPVYLGLGGRILAGDDTQFGLRIPFGMAYLLSPNHIELFAEIAPVIDLSSIGADVDGLVGIRFYSF